MAINDFIFLLSTIFLLIVLEYVYMFMRQFQLWGAIDGTLSFEKQIYKVVLFFFAPISGRVESFH